MLLHDSKPPNIAIESVQDPLGHLLHQCPYFSVVFLDAVHQLYDLLPPAVCLFVLLRRVLKALFIVV